MKYAVVIISGLAGRASEDLGGVSVLEAANTPNLHVLAESGRVGTVATLPPGAEPSPWVALGSLLGIDTDRTPTPAGPLLAARLGLHVPGQTVWRVSLRPGRAPGAMWPEDGAPSADESRALFESIEPEARAHAVRLHAGGPGWGVLVEPDGESANTDAFSEAASAALAAHEINLTRADAGLPVFDFAMLDEPGVLPSLRAFPGLPGSSAAVVTSDPASMGLARMLGMDIAEVSPPDDATLGAAAAAAVDTHTLVIVRTSRTGSLREASDDVGLCAEIEAIDHSVIGPIHRRLLEEGSTEDRTGGGWRLLVVSDLGAAGEPAPFVMAGDWIRKVVDRRFNERDAAESDLQIDPGCDLMEYLLLAGLKRTIVRSAAANEGSDRP